MKMHSDSSYILGLIVTASVNVDKRFRFPLPMASPFHFKCPFPSRTQPAAPLTQLSSRNFILRSPSSNTRASSNDKYSNIDDGIDDLPLSDHEAPRRKRPRYSSIQDFSSDDEEEIPSATLS